MKYLPIKRLILPLALSLLVAVGTAWGDTPIPVTNGDFESPATFLNTNGTGSWNYGSFTGWTVVGTGGQYQPDPSILTNLPSPTKVGWLSGGSMSQTVTPDAVAGDTYTLTVELGTRTDLAPTGFVELQIGTNDYLASGSPAAPSLWSPYTVTYTATAADNGMPISIILGGNTGGQGDFDNVQLSVASPVTSAPEPGIASIYGAFGVGLIGLVAVIRRRKIA